MIFETIRTEGLAHLSYFLADPQAGEAVVIDPRRDPDVYVNLARRHGVRITHVLDTHLHADFVSGSRELSALTSATVHVGPGARVDFDAHELRDGETLQIGRLTFRAVHTPGHSPEHVSYVLSGGGEGAQHEWAVFTGDTLLSGDVGRPDVDSQGAGDAGAPEQAARRLHHSLRAKLLQLPDGVEVYPAHGHGSPCAGRIGVRDRTTIGYERMHNKHLQALSEDQFVRSVLEERSPLPPYYTRVKELNRSGPGYLGARPAVPWLDPHEFHEASTREDAVVLDVREIEAFADAHVEGSLNVALRDQFPVWAGWMLRPSHFLLVVLDSPDHVRDVERHLLRVGVDGVAGYLRQGMRGWIEAGLPWRAGGRMSVHELHERIHDGTGDLQVLDVRRPDEWEAGHVPGAQHAFVGRLWEDLQRLDLDPLRPVAVYCGSGYRASIAVSMLERVGFRDVRNVLGSVNAWKAAGYALQKETVSA